MSFVCSCFSAVFHVLPGNSDSIVFTYPQARPFDLTQNHRYSLFTNLISVKYGSVMLSAQANRFIPLYSLFALFLLPLTLAFFAWSSLDIISSYTIPTNK